MLVLSHFGFDCGLCVVIASVPGHCILGTFIKAVKQVIEIHVNPNGVQIARPV